MPDLPVIIAVIGKMQPAMNSVLSIRCERSSKMSEKVCFNGLETEEKLNYLNEEIKALAFRQNQILGDLEYLGKQLRKVEIIQEDRIDAGLTAIVSEIGDISKKMERLAGMETVLHTIKADVKILKEL